MTNTPKRLPKAFFKNIGEMKLGDLGYVVAEQVFGRGTDPSAIKTAIDQAMVYPLPLLRLDRNRCVLELFQCPQHTFEGLVASLARPMLPLARCASHDPAQLERRFSVASMAVILFYAYASVCRLTGRHEPRVRVFLPFGSDSTAEALRLVRQMGLPLSEVHAPNNGGGEFVEYTATEADTSATMLTVSTTCHYLMEPNGAAAYHAMDSLLGDDETGVALLPFHPSVKAREVEAATGVRPGACT